MIEDNAQGIGSAGNGFKVGELSDAVCTSFIIQKNLGCFGDGGAVVTNHEKVDRAVRKLRNHGSDKRSCHSYGFNSRLDDLHAAVLSAKLKHIDEWNDLRRKWAARYTAGLQGAKTFTLPYEMPGYRHVFHLYVIETHAGGAARLAAGFPQRQRHRRQVPLPHRDPSAGRLSVGQTGAHRRPHSQLRAQCRLLHLPAHVPRADRAGSGLHDREGPRMGPCAG